MNKKLTMAVLATSALVGQQAFASKARMIALGEDKESGSYHVQDVRNIFYNPAQVNQYQDLAIFEWGSETGRGYTSTVVYPPEVDYNSGPKAQGGVIKSLGDYTLGVYFGNESDTVDLTRAVADTSTTASARNLKSAEDVLNVFFAGKASSIDWGVGLTYTSTKDDKVDTNADGITDASNGSKQYGHAISLGASTETWQGFATVGLGSMSENTRATGQPRYDGKLGLHLGLTYSWNEWTPFVSYKQIDWEQTRDTGSARVTTDGSYTNYEVGIGHERKVSDNITAYARVGYVYKEAELKFSSAPTEIKNVYVPAVFAVEGKALSWLTLRASVAQKLFGRKDNNNYGSLPGGVAGPGSILAQAEFGSAGKGSLGDTTDVAAGATLNFGDFMIDGLIGKTDFDRGSTNDSGYEDGVLTLDNLLTRVAVSYKF
jgi:hypothetical protein